MYKKLNEYDITLESHKSIIKKFNYLKEYIPKNRCFLGWDGFIDHLYTVIQSRESLNKWTPIDHMKNFGNLIKKVAGSSIGIEMILKRRVIGGFTSNVCKGMNTLGINITLASAWGYTNQLAIFKDFLKKRESIDANSFTEPGITMGLEFNDGKIMLNNVESILKINWGIITERIGIENLLDQISLGAK